MDKKKNDRNPRSAQPDMHNFTKFVQAKGRVPENGPSAFGSMRACWDFAFGANVAKE
jgi:hypothetical protein